MKKFRVKALLITVGIILGFLFVLIASFYAVSYFFIPSCCHDYMYCDVNMKDIWFALQKYSEDHQGKYPLKLEELHPKYIDLTRICCPMYTKDNNLTETGYTYIQNSDKNDPKAPILYCKRYHLNGHGPDTYCAQFNVLTQSVGIEHIRYRDIRKYNGPMRRYKYFRQFPYDGSIPTLEIVQSMKKQFSNNGDWLHFLPVQ